MKKRFLDKLGWWFAGGYVLLLIVAFALLFLPIRLPAALQGPAIIFVFLPRIVAWPWPALVEDRIEDGLVGWQIAHDLNASQISISNVAYFLIVRLGYIAWFWFLGTIASKALKRCSWWSHEKKPNKAPEPTTTSVMPRANERKIE